MLSFRAAVLRLCPVEECRYLGIIILKHFICILTSKWSVDPDRLSRGLVSRDEGMFLENVTLQLPSVSRRVWGGNCIPVWPRTFLSRTLGFQAQSILLHFPHSLNTLQQSRWKVTNASETFLKKTFNYLFFPSDFLAVGQRSTLGTNRFCDLIKTSCACSGTSFKPAAETLALWLKIPALISTWFCGHHHSCSPLLEWRLGLGYFSRIYFLLCSLLCPAVGRGNSAQETHLILLSYA